MALEKAHPKRWSVIAKLHGGKTKTRRHENDIRKRWTTVLDPTLKKGGWSKEEDESLIALVAKYGAKEKWNSDIQRELVGGNRTGKQCKARWEFALDPAVASGEWTEEEDASLVELVRDRKGEPITLSGWAAIANAKAGGKRTNKQCKRRWTKTLDPEREMKKEAAAEAKD
jgi:hypothetical protein